MGQSWPLFVYFRSFLTISIQIEKSIDGVLGIRTRGRKMVGADETTELWRPPKSQRFHLLDTALILDHLELLICSFIRFVLGAKILFFHHINLYSIFFLVTIIKIAGLCFFCKKSKFLLKLCCT